MNKLYKECLQSSFLDPSSREYKLNSIILDIANCRLFKPVNSSLSNDTPDRFLHLKFANKGIDAININNILHNKHVRKTIPPYFKYQANPKISYTYSRSIASKLFNYKQCLQDWRFTNHEYDSPPCSCSSSQFLYQPAGHIVTGDLNIVDNTCLRDLISKGPKYREPQKFSWKYNFKLIMDSIEEYARSWANQEDVELDTGLNPSNIYSNVGFIWSVGLSTLNPTLFLMMKLFLVSWLIFMTALLLSQQIRLLTMSSSSVRPIITVAYKRNLLIITMLILVLTNVLILQRRKFWLTIVQF